MKKAHFLSFLLLLLISTERSYATHNRAGEIRYAFIAPNTIQVTVATWTKQSSYQADRDTLIVHWGDGSADEPVSRTNGMPGGCCGVPNGVPIGNDIKYNTYVATHTYPGAPPPPNNFYVVSMTDPNRNSNIINIANSASVNVQFYIEDTIFYPTNIQNVGYNHSPICLNPPIDFAYVGDTFWHNPAAYDPDGDSITFRMITPLQAQGLVVPQYVDPTYIAPGPGANDIETLNTHTGMYMWATPQTVGIYNVAFLISEYRRGYLLGTIDRDMQIIVLPDTTSPPVVIIPQDTCIRAGDVLLGNIKGTDPNLSRTVTLTGYGGPLAGDPAIFPDSLSPATFTNAIGGTPITGNPALGYFRWNTVCLDIRQQPYQITFKAENNNANPKVDLKTWSVEVIPPPPLNLTTAIQNRKVQLHWKNPYLCDSIHTFRGFSIWRRVNSNPFVPEYCETGLAGRGYTMIASQVFDTSYIDLTAVHGQDLCYRILAHFSQKSPNGLYEYDKVVSVPSNEACIYLPFDVPVITTVSVLQTDPTAGQMFVAWTKPRTGGTNLDTTISPPPYRFDLYRGSGFNFASPVLIHSTTSNTFAGYTDTTYVDNAINTSDSAFSYQVQFYSNGDTVGATNQASSVYLNASPSDSKIRLSWNFNVPWTQDTFQIFRKDFSSGNVFNYITTVAAPAQALIDTGLRNDSTYCYYVKAFGHYTSPYIGAPLTDSSEIKCAVPIDTIPPCPPVVTVTNDCGTTLCDTCFQYINNLTWTEYDSCGFSTVKYNIYYASDSTDSLSLIATVTGGPGNYSYSHVLSNSSLAGCYIVTAVDKRGVESYRINKVCIEDCPNYDLPNTFTPNGDGHNDYYTPYHPYRFITRVDFKIFTRWGEKVFETTDPEIKWDGKDQKTGKDLSDGVYLYAGYYYEKTLRGEVRKTLPHKNGGGFIHLIRGK